MLRCDTKHVRHQTCQTFMTSMEPRIIWSYLSALILAAFLTASCKPKASGSSQSVVESALQKAGGQEPVQAETETLFTRFGDTSLKLLDNSDLTNCPALTQLAAGLSGVVLGIWPPGADGISVPGHIRIRFGTHTHYQFVMIFKGGSAAPASLGFVHITNNIYLKQ